MATETTVATMAELESRVQDLEQSKSHQDVSEIIRKERLDILKQLKKIREVMLEEAKSAGNDGTPGGGGGGAMKKELEALKMENEQLKKMNAKQAYRIDHLVHNMRVMMEKQQ